MDNITFKCVNCGWEKSIPGAWGDISPRFCPNDKCQLSFKKGKGKVSFRNNPDQLLKILPVKKKIEPAPQPKIDNKKKDKKK